MILVLGGTSDSLEICKELNKYNKEQIKVLVEFQERFFESTILTY